tara:strand:- start:254 stop:811 length:558 start_codon:yes stop_codon:yes gene_type:complete
LAKELLKTPPGELRWCKLLGPARSAYEQGKPDEWTTEFLLDGKDKNVIAWTEMMEQKFFELHGTTAKKNTYWFNCNPDKEDPSKLVVKFKLPCFVRNDGSKSEGPTVMDSKRNPWPVGTEIGNGSKAIIAFTIYAWNNKAGAGMTLQPMKMQVVDLVEYSGGSLPKDEEVFEEISGGYSVEKAPF